MLLVFYESSISLPAYQFLKLSPSVFLYELTCNSHVVNRKKAQRGESETGEGDQLACIVFTMSVFSRAIYT